MPPRDRRDTVSRLGQPDNVRDAAQSHRAQHGRSTSRWLAEQFGVSQRTAQRWLAGTQTPRGNRAQQILASADPSQVRINALRQVQRADFGVVRVRERSPGKLGTRTIGNRGVDFSPVADALESGASEEEAQEIYDQCVIDAYGSGEALDIIGYEGEIDYQ